MLTIRHPRMNKAFKATQRLFESNQLIGSEIIGRRAKAPTIVAIEIALTSAESRKSSCLIESFARYVGPKFTMHPTMNRFSWRW
jgi:hypothetical protein